MIDSMHYNYSTDCPICGVHIKKMEESNFPMAIWEPGHNFMPASVNLFKMDTKSMAATMLDICVSSQ